MNKYSTLVYVIREITKQSYCVLFCRLVKRLSYRRIIFTNNVVLLYSHKLTVVLYIIPKPIVIARIFACMSTEVLNRVFRIVTIKSHSSQCRYASPHALHNIDIFFFGPVTLSYRHNQYTVYTVFGTTAIV